MSFLHNIYTQGNTIHPNSNQDAAHHGYIQGDLQILPGSSTQMIKRDGRITVTPNNTRFYPTCFPCEPASEVDPHTEAPRYLGKRRYLYRSFFRSATKLDKRCYKGML
ncbi:hypothetical protein K439DRAFT_659096 [Ramaria rubella]|nr:hypothetical protein K439DRAFT_659096 [Ramaria rubella]